MKEQILGLLNAYASARVTTEPNSECITWTGRVCVKKGRSDFYPVMKFVPLKNWVSVPRYTWSLVKGELSKYDKLRNNCGNHYCVNPYHYDKKSEVCPNGHPMGEKNSYPFRQEWTKANGEVVESLAIACRACRLEGVNRRTAMKKILGR